MPKIFDFSSRRNRYSYLDRQLEFYFNLSIENRCKILQELKEDQQWKLVKVFQTLNQEFSTLKQIRGQIGYNINSKI